MTDPLMRAAARKLPRRARRWIEARLRAHLEHRTPYPALALVLHAATQPPVEKDPWGHKIRQPVVDPGWPQRLRRDSGRWVEPQPDAEAEAGS